MYICRKLGIEMDIKQFTDSFNCYPIIKKEDITLFYKRLEPDIKQTAIDWRIHSWIEKGVLKRIGKGEYTLGKTNNYVPLLDKELVLLYKKLSKNYPLLRFCIWNTKQFNEFMLHQPAQFYTIVETEKDSSEYVFHYLKQGNKEVYLNPTETEIDKYISLAQNCIVVKDMITETPIQRIDNTPTITIEKILIDVFCDSELFAAQQGSELETIFKTAFEKYTINKTKLLRYSYRRKRKTELLEFLEYLKID